MSLAGGVAASTASFQAGSVGALAAPAVLSPGDFAAIQTIMQRDARIALSQDKITLVQSRLDKRLRQHGMGNYRDYIALVQNDPGERAAMIVALTTNHTHFFRESHHFDHLTNVVLPDLKRRAAAGEPVRLWSAGCSTGEEVYSATMCLLGHNRAAGIWTRGGDVRLLATDLSPPVVAATARGTYSESSVSAVPLGYRNIWMRRQDTEFQMVDEARALVTPLVLNLFDNWPMNYQYDVIFCRNVMIYFNDDAKAELELKLVNQLRPGGTLYIGHSERLIGAAADRMITCGQTIYRKQEAALR